MSKKKNQFDNVAQAAQQIAATAARSGDARLAKQAAAVARIGLNLARAERAINSERQRLATMLAGLNATIERTVAAVRRGRFASGAKATGPQQPPGGGQGYLVDIVGRRIGRGPVQVSPSGGRSAKSLSSAFQKILSAQSELSSLKAQVESLKQKR